MKVEWKKPILTVIEKNSSEEVVLSVCKGGPEGSGGGPTSVVSFCYTNHEVPHSCLGVDQS